MKLSEDQEMLVFDARLICSAVSIVGALFVMVVYFCMSKLRSLFAFRLIMYLSSCDLLFSAAMLLGPQEDSNVLCKVQAVMITLFGLATVLWTVGIALIMYLVVLSRSRNVEMHEGKMVLVCYGLPCLVAVLPFITNSYGENLEWCWIEADHYGPVWQVAVFYGPLWVAFVVNTYCYWEIRHFLHQVLDELVGVTDEERQEKRKVVSRLKWYPWVLLFCWLIGTVDCIYTYARPDEPLFALALLHYALGSLQGAGNAFVYGCNSTVWGELKKLCCQQQEELL
jgi:hypothetical protein